MTCTIKTQAVMSNYFNRLYLTNTIPCRVSSTFNNGDPPLFTTPCDPIPRAINRRTAPCEVHFHVYQLKKGNMQMYWTTLQLIAGHKTIEIKNGI